MKQSGSVLVVGEGGHARVIAEALSSQGLRPALTSARSIDELQNAAAEAGTTQCVIGIGFNPLRKELYLKAAAAGLTMASVVAASAVIASDVILKAGCVVMPGAIVNPGAVLGKGAVVNTKASVDHDCVIGDFASLAPGVTLGGNVRLGTGTFVGVGASIAHGCILGDDCVIGAGSAVVRDIPALVVAFGVPCKVVRSRAEWDTYL